MVNTLSAMSWCGADRANACHPREAAAWAVDRLAPPARADAVLVAVEAASAELLTDQWSRGVTARPQVTAEERDAATAQGLAATSVG